MQTNSVRLGLMVMAMAMLGATAACQVTVSSIDEPDDLGASSSSGQVSSSGGEASSSGGGETSSSGGAQERECTTIQVVDNKMLYALLNEEDAVPARHSFSGDFLPSIEEREEQKIHLYIHQEQLKIGESITLGSATDSVELSANSAAIGGNVLARSFVAESGTLTVDSLDEGGVGKISFDEITLVEVIYHENSDDETIVEDGLCLKLKPVEVDVVPAP